MPRKPIRSKKALRPILFDSLRLYLETGDLEMVLKTYKLCPGRAYTFSLAYSSQDMRERLRQVWLQHRDTIMSDWKKSKKAGLPWAEKNLI